MISAWFRLVGAFVAAVHSTKFNNPGIDNSMYIPVLSF